MSGEASGSRRVGIKTLVLLAIGLILFLFALVLGFYFYAAAIAPGLDSGSASLSSPGSKSIYQIQDRFFAAQQNANLFLQSYDQTTADKQKKNIEELVALASQLKTTAPAGGDKTLSATADKIIRQAQAYSRIFQHLVQAVITGGTDPTKGLKGQLNTASNNLRQTVARNDAGNLAIALISVKVQQQDYFRTKRKVAFQNLLRATGKLIRLSRETKIDPLEAQLLRKSTKNYSSALDRYQAVSLATNDPALSSTMGKETRRQVDAMENAIAEIESIISRVNIPGISAIVMNVRQHERDYLLTGSEKSAASFEQSLSTLLNIYNNSSILQEHKNDFSQVAATYLETFRKVVENNKKIKDLTDEFNISSSALSESLSADAGKLAGQAGRAGGLGLGARDNFLIPIATITGLVVILVGIVIALLLGRSIATPITSITSILQRIIRDQDFTVEVPISSNNEIGDLAFELNNLLILQKNLSQKTDQASSVLSESMDELRAYATALSGSINIFSDTNARITDATAGQDELREQTNNSLNQLSESIEIISQTASNASGQSEQIAGSTDQVSQSLDTTISAIKAITESSSQISEIITLSTEIAEQTNLLALNASVKAARAGSHGKEFAGIADEIAKLAQRAEEVAKEASQLTEDLSAKVNESVSLGDDSQKALATIQEAGQANVETTAELKENTGMMLAEAQNLTSLADKFSVVLQEISTLAQGQEDEFNNAQETVTNLLARTSGEEKSSFVDKTEYHDDSREMRDLDIAITPDSDEGLTGDEYTNNLDDSREDFDSADEFSENEAEEDFEYSDDNDDFSETGAEGDFEYSDESEEYSESEVEEDFDADKEETDR